MCCDYYCQLFRGRWMQSLIIFFILIFNRLTTRSVEILRQNRHYTSHAIVNALSDCSSSNMIEHSV